MRPTGTKRVAATVTTAVALVLGCALAGPALAEPGPTPAPTAPKTVIDADGKYAVGTDIEPGTYRSAGPVPDGVCYWKRVRGDEIVDNALTKKPQVIQIEPTDTVFKTDHCQPWRKTVCPPDCAPAPQQPAGLPPGLKDFLDHPPSAPPGR